MTGPTPTPRDLARGGRIKAGGPPPQDSEGFPFPDFADDNTEDGPTPEAMAAAVAGAEHDDGPVTSWPKHHWLREAVTAHDRAQQAAAAGEHRTATAARFHVGFALAIDTVRALHRASHGVNRCADALFAVAAALTSREEQEGAEQ